MTVYDSGKIDKKAAEKQRKIGESQGGIQRDRQIEYEIIRKIDSQRGT